MWWLSPNAPPFILILNFPSRLKFVDNVRLYFKPYSNRQQEWWNARAPVRVIVSFPGQLEIQASAWRYSTRITTNINLSHPQHVLERSVSSPPPPQEKFDKRGRQQHKYMKQPWADRHSIPYYTDGSEIFYFFFKSKNSTQSLPLIWVLV